MRLLQPGRVATAGVAAATRAVRRPILRGAAGAAASVGCLYGLDAAAFEDAAGRLKNGLALASKTTSTR